MTEAGEQLPSEKRGYTSVFCDTGTRVRDVWAAILYTIHLLARKSVELRVVATEILPILCWSMIQLAWQGQESTARGKNDHQSPIDRFI